MTTDSPAAGGRSADENPLASRDDSPYRRHYLRFLALALSTLTLLAILGYPATTRLVGEEGIGAMFAALVVAFAASVVGTLPIYGARGKPAQEAMPAQLGAMGLRLVVILALGAGVALTGWFAAKPFLLWLVVAHAALLVADTLFARAIVTTSPSR